MIFLIAIFTVIQLVMLGASTYPIKRAWDIAAYKTKEEVGKEQARLEHTPSRFILYVAVGDVGGVGVGGLWLVVMLVFFCCRWWWWCCCYGII